MFTFVAISFNYGLTGAFKEYQRDSGTQVQAPRIHATPNQECLVHNAAARGLMMTVNRL